MAARLLWPSDEIGRAGLRAAARADRATPGRPARRLAAPRLRPRHGRRARTRTSPISRDELAGALVGRQRHACHPGAAAPAPGGGGQVELLLLERRDGRALGGARPTVAPPSRRASASRTSAATGSTARVELVEALGEGRWLVRLEGEPAGETPLPPYITEPLDDPSATRPCTPTRPGPPRRRPPGCTSRPSCSATLDVERVTLHVGLDTFRPLQTETLEEHVLHGERYHVEPDAWARIRDAERVLAVGTTTTRVLETVVRSGAAGGPHDALHHARLRVPPRRRAADQLPPAALDAPRARDGVRRRRARPASCTASRSPSGTGSTRSATPCSSSEPVRRCRGTARPSTTRDRGLLTASLSL